MEKHSFEDGSSPSNLLHLSDELLEHLFSCQELTHRDVVQLSQVCWRFHLIARSQNLWKVKVSQRWPKKCAHPVPDDWLEAFKMRHKIEKDVVDLLRETASDALLLEIIPKFMLVKYDQLFGSCDEKLDMVIECLRCLWEQKVEHCPDLNLKYYGKKVYHYVYQLKLRKEWSRLLADGAESSQALEAGATLISKWCCPYLEISLGDISAELDKLAELVMARYHAMTGSKTCSEDPMKAISVINSVLFEDVGFKGNSINYYDMRNSFIDQVLATKSGIPVSLSIVYAAVARRLGIVFEGVNFPSHFLLRINLVLEGWNTTLYLDAFNKGALLDEDECLATFLPGGFLSTPRAVLFQSAPHRKIFSRMVSNIVNILRQQSSMDVRNLDTLQNALELQLLLDPTDDDHRLLLSRIYLHYGINIDEVVESLRNLFASPWRSFDSSVLDALMEHARELQEKSNCRKIEPKFRTSEGNECVRFRVGQLVRDKRHLYHGVIHGWDPVCRMDETWKQQTQVHTLPSKDLQPFYHVLAHDGSSRYAAQENLEPVCAAKVIPHPDIGKFFRSFNGRFYVATDCLKMAYPDDQPFPDDYLRNEEPPRSNSDQRACPVSVESFRTT